MKSETYGEVSIDEMATIIKDYIEKEPNYDYNICVGCDSQNTNLTKVVVVVAIHRVGKGGIYFYEISEERLITNLKQKIYHETSVSIDIATKISECLKLHDVHQKVEIHADVGTNRIKGKTYSLVNEITKYVEACGFECKIKPESYTASCVANRISK
jgi:predicted RNase H-related nuclease YkuK (DUF458 family)